MRETDGSVLLILLLVVLLGFHLGRAALVSEGLPAFFLESTEGISISLGQGFPRPGVHQFSDETSLADVIKMTSIPLPPGSLSEDLLRSPLRGGEHLEIRHKQHQVIEINRSWLPAGQRIALGLPLHPDHMSREDWQVLPGIGVRLAETIEGDRHKNGDFGSLEGLERVKGIGPGRIASWKEFFNIP